MTGRRIAYLGVLAVLAVAAWVVVPGGRAPDEPDLASLSVPELSVEERAGQALFQENCAVCHGENASGSQQGPPLVHRIYEPGHHGDMAFVLAAAQGVRQHHWQFGDMPRVEGLDERDVLQITAFVRALQRANGID